MGYFSESIKSIGKILLVVYAVTAILLFFTALLMKKFQWDQAVTSIAISISYIVSCFIGGFLMGKVQRTKKFIWGILMGLVYIIIMLMISMAVKHGLHSTMSEFIINLLLCLGGGMLGGMIS